MADGSHPRLARPADREGLIFASRLFFLEIKFARKETHKPHARQSFLGYLRGSLPTHLPFPLSLSLIVVKVYLRQNIPFSPFLSAEFSGFKDVRRLF